MIVGIGVVVALLVGLISLWQLWSAQSQDPIRIDSGGVWVSRNTCGSFYALVKGGVDPSKDLDYYEDNAGLLIYENPSLQMDIVSQVKDETLKVAPYLLIKTTDIKPLRKPGDYIEDNAGPCASGITEQFVGTLAPNREKVFGVPQDPNLWVPRSPELYGIEKVPADYFTLAPGERDVFDIALIATSPGFLYRFKAGVQYSYRGNEEVIWTDKEFEAAGYPLHPLKADVYKGHRGPQVLPRVDMQTQHMYTKRSIESQERELQKYQSYFKLPRSGPEE